MNDVIATFPNASKSTIEANPHIFAPRVTDTIAERPQREQQINQTEAAYALILEATRHRGEITRWLFEGMTLRWFDMKYTPDFVVFPVPSGRVILIEVKGAKIWDRDLVRFKGARAFWPEFQFEMHQLKKGEWSRLY